MNISAFGPLSLRYKSRSIYLEEANGRGSELTCYETIYLGNERRIRGSQVLPARRTPLNPLTCQISCSGGGLPPIETIGRKMVNMDSSPKRRARFKKGVPPPPLNSPVKLSWFEEDNQRAEEGKQRQEERLRNRKPLTGWLLAVGVAARCVYQCGSTVQPKRNGVKTPWRGLPMPFKMEV